MWSLYKRTLVGNFFGLFFPSSLGADALHGVLTREVLPGRADPWLVVFTGRAIGILSLPILCCAALLVSAHLHPAAASVVVLTALVALVALAMLMLAAPIAERVAGVLGPQWSRVALVVPQLAGRGVLWRLVGLSASSLLLGAMAQVVVLMALVPDLDLGASVFAVLLSQLATAMPSLLGLGPSQLALVALLGPQGIDGTTTMSAAMIRWVVGATEALGGAVLYMLGRVR